ncbi:hypothetical protein [Flavobacterium commune]|uniref:Uncharacterized protein n=1 Tax=Flavobacterium commune TaxID=1306519 RepID=A0A1D9P7I3_9FLAO|nr:hypothetical protein [Flavobacterium commune]AOZ98519.1 hypothetical protein BIW12_03210 [Flavobacterium commune]
MLKDCVLVLGSGKSILNLTKTERELLNTCEVKIGINKFAAFYELAGIEPSHVYFHDDYDESSIRMLNYIFKLFRKNKLKKMTFILSENYKGFVFTNYAAFWINKAFNFFKIFLVHYLVKIGRFTIKKINVDTFNRLNFYISHSITINPVNRYNLMSKESKIEFIRIQDSIARGNKWSKSLVDPLYHFKGSFSTVLNYISICYPNKTILLAGVDFNSSDYFFEEELYSLNFNTRDWTYEMSKHHDKHYSIIETDGNKIDDELPLILDELKKTDNVVYSLNELSYLVDEKYIKFVRLVEFLDNEK